ncbi:polysialic acid transport protein KpsD precursor [bacterium BMS3Abin08]|nr:polysialic acid transport protein KpsD precursor [bacterium BMS3Abin08]
MIDRVCRIMKPLFMCFSYSVFLVVLLTSGCAGTNEGSSVAYLQQSLPDRRTEELNNSLFKKNLLLKKPFSMADYKIGPEDLLDIDVFQVEDLKASVRVTARGFIRLPLIGRVKAAGLTVAELEDTLSGKLEKYLEQPVVSVFVKEYRSQQITVLGAVKNPQQYSVSGPKRLLEILSIAGGLTDEAGDLCYIQKASGESDAPQRYVGTVVINLNELLMKGKAELNIPLSSGDVVNIPKRGVFFVDGAVKDPGSFQIKGRTTIIQAVSMAKGLKYEADGSSLRIYRDNGAPEREIISVDYDAIVDGRGNDVVIKSNDIIIVPKSGVKDFFSKFVSTLRGFISFGKAL